MKSKEFPFLFVERFFLRSVFLSRSIPIEERGNVSIDRKVVYRVKEHRALIIAGLQIINIA